LVITISAAEFNTKTYAFADTVHVLCVVRL